MIYSGGADSEISHLVCNWLIDQKAGFVAPKGCTSLLLFKNNSIQAGVAFHNFTPESVTLTYSLIKPSRLFMAAVLNYAFADLDKKHIWGYASSENEKALRLLKSAGAVLHATLNTETETQYVYRYDRKTSKYFERLKNG